MARIQSLDILLTSTGNDFLAEVYGAVIENVQKQGISNAIKNTALSGTPTSGTVEAKRFVNRTSNTYGTARTGHAGQAVKAEPVVIAINQDKELVTEIENKDVSLYGVDAFVQKQAAMDEKSMLRELERAFWTEATTAGTKLTLNGTTPEEKAEEMIQAVETVSNNYVDGVDRALISLVLAPSEFGALRTYIDKVQDGGAAGEEINMFHGVKVYSSVYLPAGTKGVAIADGSIAQPVLVNKVGAEKVPFSNAIAQEIFYSYGTKAVSADLIMWA